MLEIQHVRAGHEQAYRQWQTGITAVVMAQPGFRGSEVIPPTPGGDQNAWTVVFRFATSEQLDEWLQSPDYQRQYEQAEHQVFSRAPQAHRVHQAARKTGEAHASLFIAQQVKAGKDNEYASWQRQMYRRVSVADGFVSSDVLAPDEAEDDGKIIHVIRFSSLKALNAWLDSPERHEMLQEARHILTEDVAHPVASGFPGWFTGKDPAAIWSLPNVWKQTLIVFAGLNPLVWLTAYYLTPNLQDHITLAGGLLVANFLIVVTLAYVVTTKLTQLFDWWIEPLGTTRATTVKGAALLIASIALSLVVFIYLPH